jgi:hypothetical protein
MTEDNFDEGAWAKNWTRGLENQNKPRTKGII